MCDLLMLFHLNTIFTDFLVGTTFECLPAWSDMSWWTLLSHLFLVLHCPVFLAPPLFLSLSLSLLLSVSFYVSLSRGWIAIASRNPLSAGISPEETAEEEVAAALCMRRQRTLGSWMKFAFRQWSTATDLYDPRRSREDALRRKLWTTRFGESKPHFSSKDLHSAALPLKLENAKALDRFPFLWINLHFPFFLVSRKSKKTYGYILISLSFLLLFLNNN